MNAIEMFHKGGVTMWPLLFLSIFSLATIFERLWFWFKTTRREEELVERVLEANRQTGAQSSADGEISLRATQTIESRS
jgi:biopolymer transport protein ExbB